MIHVIVGDGQGKTTSAVGLSVRAAGHGYDVLFVQFLKDDTSGEIAVLKSVPTITVLHAPISYGFLYQMTDEQKEKTAAEYEKMLTSALRSEAFLIVLDEVLHALNAGLVKRDQIERLLEKEKEIVLTGSEAPEWLTERADYVSYIRKVKHPYDRGVDARIGIEF